MPSLAEREFVPQPDGSYSEYQLREFLEELRDEPPWRDNAALEEEYYDGNQLDQATLQLMAENGLPPIIVNRIKPAIDSVVGFEALTRRDPRVLPENDDSVQGAEGLNALLKETIRLAEFNEAYTEAFLSSVKIGIGWVEVSRNPDPFEYPYRCVYVPWREMWWDWRARRKDLMDARYIMRRKWMDRDVLATMFPDQREIIFRETSNWPTGAPGDWDDTDNQGAHPMGRSLDTRSTYSSVESYEWLDPSDRRVALFEMLYWVPSMVTVMKLSGGRKIEFDKNNAMHRQAVTFGAVQLETGPSKKLRQAFYLGPHRLKDRPIQGRTPHYIPVIYALEGGDGSPYGLVRAMKSPQESYNARRTRILHDLSARRVVASGNAVDDHDRAAEEVGRPDAYIQLSDDFDRQKDLFEVQENVDTSPISFSLMQADVMDIEAASGVSKEFKGETSGANQSGDAIGLRTDAARQTMGLFFTRYNTQRMKGADLCVQYRVADLQGESDVDVHVERTGMKAAHKVRMNRREADGMRTNDVALMRTRIALADFPASATHRQQQALQLSEVMKSLPDEIQAVLTDIYVSMLDTPHQDDILDRIREVTGFGPESDDPQERAAQQEAKAEQAAMQQKMAELEMLEREAEARLKLANASLTEAKAAKLATSDTQLTDAKVISELAKIEQDSERGEREEVDLQRKLEETATNLMLKADEINDKRDEVERKAEVDKVKARQTGKARNAS